MLQTNMNFKTIKNSSKLMICRYLVPVLKFIILIMFVLLQLQLKQLSEFREQKGQ